MNHTLELVLLIIAGAFAVATLVRAKFDLVAWGLLLVVIVLAVPLIR